MKKTAESILVGLPMVTIFIALPAVIVWGWVRWLKQKQPRSWASILSLIGFTLATASALLAIPSLVYAYAIGGFPFGDPLRWRIYAWGGWLFVVGIVFAISGAWRAGPLRWQAPVCAMEMLIFWLIEASGE